MDRQTAMKRSVWRLAVLVVLIASTICLADDPVPDLTPLKSELPPDTVVATVNSEPIKLVDVNEAIAAVAQGRPINANALAQLQAEVLEQLIDRTLLMQSMNKSEKAVPESEISKAIEQLKQQASDKKIEFSKLLTERHLTEDDLRRQVAWQLSWGKYLQSHLDDEALKAYFEAHRRDFDGSEVRASHILLRPDGPGTAVENERLRKMANKLREQISSGNLTFEAAAEKYSAGPSRRQGGDMGFIPRHGLMLEPFAQAAFRLEQGQVSEPVATIYGIHLIRVTDIKPGKKSWADAKNDLKAPASQALFQTLAEAERRKAKVAFTGKIPHYKPGTKELTKDGS